MVESGLYEQLDFSVNELYEKIITDITTQQYAVVDTFFTSEETQQLRNALLGLYEEEEFKKAAIGNKVNENIITAIRGDYIFWIDESKQTAVEQLFFSKVNDLVAYLNRTCFLGILHKEFHYAYYPKGTFYKRHLDTFQNDDRRKLSMVFYLNDEAWQKDFGGELVIYKNENHQEQEITITPLAGRVVIFESQLLEHEVKPVTQPRLSITGWLKTR